MAAMIGSPERRSIIRMVLQTGGIEK